MELLLGLDVGTTATKALLFDRQGTVVAEAAEPYGLLTPEPGRVEQDPEALWQAVTAALRTVSRCLVPGDSVLALAQSSQGGTVIPVDGAGRPTYNAISWLDVRARDACPEATARYDSAFLYRLTGWPFDPAVLSLKQIAWFRRHCPAEFARTRHFLFVNDFIGRRLTGELCMDPSNASITQLLNITTGDWDERLLDLAGIRRDQLSPVCPSGQPFGAVTAAAAAATGLAAGTPVVNGAHDQYCAAVGTGVATPGPVLLSCGTAWVLLAVPPDLAIGLQSGMALSRHAVPGRWGALRSLGGVGTSLEWLLDNAWSGSCHGGERPQLFAELNAAVAATEPGAHGLLFYPLAGGHAAAFGQASRGGFAGLNLGHRQGDLGRAVMEGIACELRWALAEMQAAGVIVSELTMVGGAARSATWPQIVADITGLPVALPAVSQAASWGAAILAVIGVGACATWEDAAALATRNAAHCKPRPELGGRYAELFAEYRALCPAVAGGSAAMAKE